jgi:hypothetical protein
MTGAKLVQDCCTTRAEVRPLHQCTSCTGPYRTGQLERCKRTSPQSLRSPNNRTGARLTQRPSRPPAPPRRAIARAAHAPHLPPPAPTKFPRRRRIGAGGRNRQGAVRPRVSPEFEESAARDRRTDNGHRMCDTLSSLSAEDSSAIAR